MHSYLDHSVSWFSVSPKHTVLILLPASPGSTLLSVVKGHVGSLLTQCRVHIEFNQILLEPNSVEPSGLKKAGAGHGSRR